MSAQTESSLQMQIRDLQEYSWKHPELVKYIAYTRAVCRQNLAHKAYAIVHQESFAEVSRPTRAAGAKSSGIAMVFTGQGAQWSGMAKELISSHPSFQHDLDLMDGVLQALAHPPTWSLVGMLIASPDDLVPTLCTFGYSCHADVSFGKSS